MDKELVDVYILIIMFFYFVYMMKERFVKVKNFEFLVIVGVGFDYIDFYVVVEKGFMVLEVIGMCLDFYKILRNSIK